MDNFSKTYWRAIHTDKTINSSDHKIKDFKPYTKVTRATLIKLIFYRKDKNKETILKVFERPDQSDWQIRWRLRSTIGMDNSGLKDRFWIVDDERTICLIRGNQKVEEFVSYEQADRTPITRTPLDIL